MFQQNGSRFSVNYQPMVLNLILCGLREKITTRRATYYTHTAKLSMRQTAVSSCFPSPYLQSPCQPFFVCYTDSLCYCKFLYIKYDYEMFVSSFRASIVYSRFFLSFPHILKLCIINKGVFIYLVFFYVHMQDVYVAVELER